MVVIGALAVIVAICIPMVSNVVPNAKESTATSNLEYLNRAVLKFNQAAWELVLAPNDSSTDDEVQIVRSLQYRNPNADKATAGAPYLSANTTLTLSTSDSTYRAAWNGRMFQLIPPGTDGEGLDLMLMNDGGTTAQFDNNYKPVGAK